MSEIEMGAQMPLLEVDADIRLLLVEDDVESGDSMKAMLERRGVEVTLVPGAEQALEEFARRRFDVLVSDIRLQGGMNGVDLLKRLRVDRPDFPVILLTGFDSMQSAIQAVRLGAQDYILKPLDQIEDLLNPVKKAVRQYHLILRNRALEGELRESEAKFRSVLEHSVDVAFRVDLEKGKIDYISPSVSHVLGLDAAEVRLKSAAEMLALAHPDDSGAIQELCDAVRLHGQGGKELPTSLECRVRKGEEDHRWLSVRCSLVVDKGNRPTALVGNARDVTEQKLAEERQQQLQDRLARVERLESLSILAAGVAHDLNNILNVLLVMPRLVIMELEQRDFQQIREKVKDDLTAIESSAQRAATLVRDLLTMGRRGKYHLEPLSLNAVLEDYMRGADFRELVNSHPKVVVEQAFDTGLNAIRGSGSHLLQVVMNLVINAVEAMSKGGGKLLLKTFNQVLDNGLQGYETVKAGRYAVMEVRDTGSGIPKEHLNRLFEPFYSSKQMGKKSGSGLGLAIVHGVVKDHGGFVDVRTELGKGTSFVLYFPLTDELVKPRREESAILTGEGTVLVVDDSKEQLVLCEKMLTTLGYQVTTAASGREALDRLKKLDLSPEGSTDSPCDLVILDMVIEGDFDGLDTYRGILKEYPRQKCMIMSGQAPGDRLDEAQKLGAYPFIKKPYTAEELEKAVQTALSGQR